jgi:hypothetical protein
MHLLAVLLIAAAKLGAMLGVEALSFYPRDAAFNRINALYLAHASDVAYHRAPITAARDRLGLDAVAFRNKVTRTRGFLGVCDTHAVLAFRGTDPITLPNWLTDAIVQLVVREEYVGRVHHGFSAVLNRTWDKVQSVLEEAVEDRPLFLTGHSMGGALAVLTACRLAKAGRPPVAVYTFGSPRIGDRAFCAAYALPTYRIVNRLDLVPELPLRSVAAIVPRRTVARARLMNAKIGRQIKRMVDRVPSYAHINTFVYIDRDGEITLNADVEPWHTHAVARAIATRGKSFHEGITDHLIANYIRALENPANEKPADTRVRRRVRVK